MKLLIFILSILSLSAIKPKFCVTCKFFKQDLILGPNYGVCSKFPKYKSLDYSVINGKNKTTDVSYDYCVIARKYEDMCGKEGKLYESNNW
jgi:hypothetical protein